MWFFTFWKFTLATASLITLLSLESRTFLIQQWFKHVQTKFQFVYEVFFFALSSFPPIYHQRNNFFFSLETKIKGIIHLITWQWSKRKFHRKYDLLYDVDLINIWMGPIRYFSLYHLFICESIVLKADWIRWSFTYFLDLKIFYFVAKKTQIEKS